MVLENKDNLKKIMVYAKAFFSKWWTIFSPDLDKETDWLGYHEPTWVEFCLSSQIHI